MSNPRKSPNFRPNSSRALYVTGTIDQGSLDRLTPQAVELLGESHEPLTVFIDSPGGSTFFAEGLYQTLKLCDQDTGESRRVITVGLNLAASAACDLLIAGDYAIVQPHTILLCHGVRQSADGLAVTRETASALAKTLARSNEQYALQMASNAISRFIFRFAMLRPNFDSLRQKLNKPNHTDASCFLEALEPHVSPGLWSLLTRAMFNYLDNEVLDIKVEEKFKTETNKPASAPEFEAFLLKCIIEYQVADNAGKPNWSLRSDGLQSLEEKFTVLMNSHEDGHKDQIRRLVARWGEFLLNEDESTDFSQVPESEKQSWLDLKVNRTVRSLWFLFVAICRLLQQNENYLSAEEAYWIGLVDEITGRSDLPCPRLFVEFAFESPEGGAVPTAS